MGPIINRSLAELNDARTTGTVDDIFQDSTPDGDFPDDDDDDDDDEDDA
jgi:hypothetical protein